MSFPRVPLPSDQAFKGAQERREEAIEQRAMLDQNDAGVSEAPRNRGIADRLRRVLRRGRSPAPSSETGVSDGNVWEREREHRRASERD
jgi:hypothetical protein